MSHVFFVESTLRRTLLALGDHGVKPNLAQFEKAAAYMADGYARVAKRPGICMAQSVGAANIASGYRMPGSGAPGHRFYRPQGAVVPAPQFLSGNPARAAVPAGDEIFQPGLFDERVAASAAARLARGARRHGAADASDFTRPARRRHRTGPDRRRAGARNRAARDSGASAGRDERDIERAASLLAGARRLVIVAGDGAASSEGRARGAGLGEALTRRSRRRSGRAGIIPTTHRLSAGVAGSYSAPPANRIVHGADLVLFIGCDTGDQVTLNWTIPPINTKIVQIEADPLEIGRSFTTTPPVWSVTRKPRWRSSCRSSAGRRDDGSYAEEAARIVADWRASLASLCREEFRPDRGGTAVRRGHPRAAGRRGCWSPIPAIPGSGPHNDRDERCRAELSARSRGHSAGPSRRRSGAQMRRRAAQGRLLLGDGGFTITSPN